MSNPIPSWRSPARNAVSRSPPCAPTPGAKIHKRGARVRTCLSASGWVAPTTSPRLSRVFQRWASPAMYSYSRTGSRRGSATTARSCRSAAPGLEVLHKRKAPRSGSIGQNANQSVFATLICEPKLPFVEHSTSRAGVPLAELEPRARAEHEGRLRRRRRDAQGHGGRAPDAAPMGRAARRLCGCQLPCS